ncbi:hypothetical protein M2169_000991 [Streptomyces sp. MJP52]|nr:hypothetical protein [Streptomyces sp. MJP52]
MTWQNNPQPPPPVPPQQPATAPRRAKGRLGGLLALGVVLALGFGASQVFKEDDGTTSAPSSSSSSSAGASQSSGDQESRRWKKGDCGGPDPEKGSDSYRMFDCDAPGATFKALEIMDGSFMPESVQCPAGTDLIIEVSITYGGSDSGGIPSETVCGRNLSDDHPGDAGAGGGQLVEGDCVDSRAQEIACSGAGAADHKVLGLVKKKSECPAGTTEPMELLFALGRPYDVICGGAV